MTTMKQKEPDTTPLMADPGVRARVIGWAIAAVIFVSGAVYGTALLMTRLGPTGTANEGFEVEEALKTLSIPEFVLVDQNGRRVGRSVFLNRVTVLAFSFTNCPVACPIMHAHLIRMQEALRGSMVRIATISVDPVNDTPEALRAYAAKKAIDLGRWTMLTGEAKDIVAVLEGLKVSVSEDRSLMIELPDGTEMANIVHSTRLFLIGPDGSVIGMEDGMSWASVERLAQRARSAQALIQTTR